MRAFIDNNLSRHLANGMNGFGEKVIHLLDKFSGDTPDSEWLEYAGNQGMVVITRDERVRWRPAERRAMKVHKVGAFFLGGKNRTRCQLIQQLVRNWPQVKELANTNTPPYAFRIPSTGTKITQLAL